MTQRTLRAQLCPRQANQGTTRAKAVHSSPKVVAAVVVTRSRPENASGSTPASRAAASITVSMPANVMIEAITPITV
ncbi:hypothetical protein [Modestobacter sp. I12A-02662]|uniref:hypothetical protein n=1 Tax=Modestobacter sp. I12A-02662 TaxID=1730496 RepID=UPI0034DE7DED